MIWSAGWSPGCGDDRGGHAAEDEAGERPGRMRPTAALAATLRIRWDSRKYKKHFTTKGAKDTKGALCASDNRHDLRRLAARPKARLGVLCGSPSCDALQGKPGCIEPISTGNSDRGGWR
jgi:hypothetical protein